MTRRSFEEIPVACNGLLDRRSFLRSGLGVATGLSLMQAQPLSAAPEQPGVSTRPEQQRRGTLATARPIKTIGSDWPHATTVFDYIRRAMPYPDPGSLGDAEVYDLTAHLLYLNGLVGPDDVIDAETLPFIEMPNSEGFDPRSPSRSADPTSSPPKYGDGAD